MRRMHGWIATASALVLAGCGGAGGRPGESYGFAVASREGPTPWTRLDGGSAPGDLRFAVVADRTGGCRKGVFARAMGKINLLGPEFVICVGDLIEGHSEDANVVNAQFDEFDALEKGAQLWWRPDWRRDQAIDGSGTFVRR